MSGPANDNDRTVRYASTVRPRDEQTPDAEFIGMEVDAPVSDERLALAVETLEDGLSVLVFGKSQQEASDGAWQIISAMAPAVVR